MRWMKLCVFLWASSGLHVPRLRFFSQVSQRGSAVVSHPGRRRIRTRDRAVRVSFVFVIRGLGLRRGSHEDCMWW
jgi:hypothetical protein